MKILFIICILCMFPSGLIFSQTEYDYYEKLRLERKDAKIKTVSLYEIYEDALGSKDYFDENGFLIKRELYYTSVTNFETTLWKEFVITDYNKDGKFDVTEREYSEGALINEFNLQGQTYIDFYDIGYGQTTVENVEYIFDKSGLLIEKRSYGEDMMYGTGKEYESEYFYYDQFGRMLKSVQGESITKYFYNESGLLQEETLSYEFQNDGRDYGVRYEYEFY